MAAPQTERIDADRLKVTFANGEYVVIRATTAFERMTVVRYTGAPTNDDLANAVIAAREFLTQEDQ